MTKTYKISQKWKYALLGLSIALFFVLIFPFFTGKTAEEPSKFIWVDLLAAGIASFFSFAIISSKISTNSSHIETEMLWIRAKTSWKNVEKVELDARNTLHLMCKEPINYHPLAAPIARWLKREKTFQIGLQYLDKAGVKGLLADVEKRVKNGKVPQITQK